MLTPLDSALLPLVIAALALVPALTIALHTVAAVVSLTAPIVIDWSDVIVAVWQAVRSACETIHISTVDRIVISTDGPLPIALLVSFAR